MRLDVFLLSDAASTADGKLYVHGGGITRINAPVLPLTVPLAMTARLVYEDAEEAVAPHTFGFEVLDPTGEAVVPPLRAESESFDSPGEAAEGEERYLQLVLGLLVSFETDGIYHVKLTVDDEVVRDLTLPVVFTPPVTVNRAERRRQQRAKS